MWFYDLLFSGEHVANAVIVVALVSFLGLGVGQIKFGPVQLGIAGPLFAGIALGHFGFRVNTELLAFEREFGLILYVYAIGISVGPGFFAAFQTDGAILNLIAVSIVLMGALTAVAIHYLLGLPLEVVAGLLSGATTNTPSLAAAQQMLLVLHAGPDRIAKTGLSCAISYPFGIVGVLLTIGTLRSLFGVNLETETERFKRQQSGEHLPLERMSIEIRNSAVTGIALSDVPALHGIVIGRLLREGRQHVAAPTDIFEVGDTILCIGPRPQLDNLRASFGVESNLRLNEMESPLRARDMLVTQRNIFGRRIADLHIRELYGVTITRLNRTGVELSPTADTKLHFGDYLICVGEEDQLQRVEQLLGNQTSALENTQIIPIFIGIALGVLLGSVPISIPGVPVPLSLGLAGGPIVAAIILSRIGTLGPLRWNMPPDTINTIRDFGVSIFMACVGIDAGKSFVATVMNGDGLLWMGYAAIITVVPICIAGAAARSVLKLNYLTLCGVLAGSMTDPPALAFANAIADSQAQSTAYAAVYPLTMALRILAPQLLLGILWHIS